MGKNSFGVDRSNFSDCHHFGCETDSAVFLHISCSKRRIDTQKTIKRITGSIPSVFLNCSVIISAAARTECGRSAIAFALFGRIGIAQIFAERGRICTIFPYIMEKSICTGKRSVTIVISGIRIYRSSTLLYIVYTLSSLPASTGALQCRQQNCSQNCDDGNYYQEFNKSKARLYSTMVE